MWLRVPVLEPREAAKLLERLGFVERVSEALTGSTHTRMAEERPTVPYHPGRDISPTLLRKIARDVGLTVEELLGRE